MATTITVTESTLDRFNRLKAQSAGDNDPEPSADLFLQSLMDAWENPDNQRPVDRTDDEIAEQLVEERKRVTNVLEGRIDDLEAELPRKVAEELR